MSDSEMKGYLIVDDVSLEEAKEIMKKLGLTGRWISPKAMSKIDKAAAFAMLTHGFPRINPKEVFEFKKEASEK